MRGLSALAMAALALVGASQTAAEAPCRQALALGMDVSASVDADEYALPRDGLARALTAPEVVTAFETLPSAPISVMVFEWSGYRSQTIVVP